ncbi:protein adenylyltransferase SelO [Swaminathania salitolerans]|uniref:Protein nucleotidyltransferase YdiU n=1 Tax=Swaminathania salitolerans TaxID=182838 RepID=A0A511BM44_9PROT|nr:YdiU family protein [Swaminathania salitolerans]GBQ09487.1 hypothetical protein AA21291_0090 [Swaminathania salitolerans LMG 21291]GEL00953.1 UPF0061 protein [Swaminathania salitolerans]
MSLSLRAAPFPDTMAIAADPARLETPRLIALNSSLAGDLDLPPDWLAGPDGVAFLAGQALPDGIRPVAQAYAGHQFGQFVPQLGDGRAHLLGVVTDMSGQTRDIQLKGSGPTPFSRRGDGLAALGPVLREYLVSEGMAALGVPTTRSLAALLTGERVWRDTPQPGAILVRVATSHLRVGTFQYFAARENREALDFLSALAIERHYPDAADTAHPVRTLYEKVVNAQADLVAQWMSLGFVHGVMNTDNMALSGETIDYGPCAFLDVYRPDTVFSAIDRDGRYRFENQPRMAGWNLARLAETLLPLIDSDEDRALSWAQTALSGFGPAYEAHYLARMRRKLGLQLSEEADMALVSDLLAMMTRRELDYTLTFRRLSNGLSLTEGETDDGEENWIARWKARQARESRSRDDQLASMRETNPAIIPRNHRIAQAIAAAEQGDYSPFRTLLTHIATPFRDDPDYATPPMPAERVTTTYCGT